MEDGRARMEEFGVSTPWQAYVQMRLRYYHAMLDDTATLRAHQWPGAVELLGRVRGKGCRTGLATMSRCEQARRILEALEETVPDTR